MYIVFEGVDGSGKSTIVNEIMRQLEGNKIVKVSEPTDGVIGKYIREQLKDESYMETFDTYDDYQRHMLSLFKLDHRDLMFKKTTGVKALLGKDNIVISDRSLLSGLVYNTPEQEDYTELIDDLFKDTIAPDILIFIDVDLDLIRERLEGREKQDMLDSYENVVKHSNRYLKVMKDLMGNKNHNIKVYTFFVNSEEQTPEVIYRNIIGTLISDDYLDVEFYN
jgi:dTMP kinase